MPLSRVRKEDIGHLRAWAAENAVRASVSPEASTPPSTGSSEVSEVTVGRNIDF
ncbi:hypothetical protein D3C76_1877040 [compost metagenome]